MAKAKQYVFSARTTEEGLRKLNDLRNQRGIGWDELVIEAVCAHYGLDKDVMAIPKQARAEKTKKPKYTGNKSKKTKSKEEVTTGS